MAKISTVSDFTAHKGEILEIWDEMQNLQCDFCVGLELPTYFRSKQWGAAETVADLGTGNGRYLGYLARYFPEKRYFGFDLVPELIENAKARIKLNNVTFFQENLFDLDGLYDAVVLRLVIQHLADAEALLGSVCRIVRPGGAIFIIDACDELRIFAPSCEPFLSFFQTYADYQRSLGLDRDVIKRSRMLVEGRADLEIVQQDRLLIPSSIEGNFDLMHRNYYLFTRLVELSGGLEYDFDALRQAWQAWGQNPGVYTQVGLDLIELAYDA